MWAIFAGAALHFHLIRRATPDYKPYNANLKEATKSAQDANRFRLILGGLGPGSRTKTRTNQGGRSKRFNELLYTGRESNSDPPKLRTWVAG